MNRAFALSVGLLVVAAGCGREDAPKRSSGGSALLAAPAPQVAAGGSKVGVTTFDPEAQFQVATAPTLTSLTPVLGPTTATRTVTVTGTNFTSGFNNANYPKVKFGGLMGARVGVPSATEIRAQSPVPHAAGIVDVVVCTEPGVCSAANDPFDNFTYVAPPDVTALDPDNGSACGGNTVVIRGANFDPNATVSFGGVAVTPTGRTDGAQEDTITVTAPPNPSMGETVQVRVTNFDGTNPNGQWDELPYRYRAPTVDRAEVADWAQPGPTPPPVPAYGTTAGGTSVTLTGSDFCPAIGFQQLSVNVGGRSAPVNSADDTSIVFTTRPGLQAKVDITVMNPDGQFGTLTDGFTYVNPPTIHTVMPTWIPTSSETGRNITLTGVDFRDLHPWYSPNRIPIQGIGDWLPSHTGPEVILRKTNYPDIVIDRSWTSVQGCDVDPDFPSCTTIVASVNNFIADEQSGTYDIIVVNNDGLESAPLPGSLHIVSPNILVRSIRPDQGPSTGGTRVTIEGTNFVNTFEVEIGGAPATVVSIFEGAGFSDLLEPPLDNIVAVTAPHASGIFDVVVLFRPPTPVYEDTLELGYTYAAPQPTITRLDPTSGPTAGGTRVTITGTNFIPSTRVQFGGLNARSVLYMSSTRVIAVTPTHAEGPVNVRVINPDPETGDKVATRVNGFTYEPPPPTAPVVSDVQPPTGPTAGGTDITITGVNFVAGATVLVGAAAATSVVVVDSMTITATTTAHAAGVVDVTVTNPNGELGSLAQAFAYVPPPGIVSVDPNTGPTAGGTAITISGGNFFAGATVTLDGVAATDVVVVDIMTITATTPAHAAGAVAVVVANADGQGATLDSGFTYVDEPEPAPEPQPDAGPGPDAGDRDGGVDQQPAEPEPQPEPAPEPQPQPEPQPEPAVTEPRPEPGPEAAAEPRPEAPIAEPSPAEPGPDGGLDGAARDTGASDQSGDQRPSDGATDGPKKKASSGCDCNVSGSGSPGSALLALPLVLFFGRWRRRAAKRR